MKIGKAEFSAHEFALLLLCLGFFSLMFFGSFTFKILGKVFPLFVSTPGLLLVILYLLSGYLPGNLYKAMKRETEFRLFGITTDKVEDIEGEREPDEGFGQFRIHHSYLVLALSMGYILFSYLFGFYISTFIFTSGYLFVFRRKKKGIPAMLSNLLLVAILLALVYIFDLSFGYIFGEGLLLKMFQNK